MPAPRRSRFLPQLGAPLVVGLSVLAVVVAVVVLAPEPEPEPALQLVALAPDGAFRDTLVAPATLRDTTPRGATRVPLVLGVRNTGAAPARPDTVTLSLPARYRLEVPGRVLVGRVEAGSPLATYTTATGLTGPVAPGRLPELLPSVDTVWLEVAVPRYYCVALGDSVPELIPAPAPPPATLSDVRIFYSFAGGDLDRRRTGTLTVHLDPSLVELPEASPPPTFPVRMDTALATPDVGELRHAGTKRAECGEPQAPMELGSTLWLTEGEGRVIELEYGGAVRKRLYDLDADGVVERESWDADGDGVFESTRRARLPTPAFLIPAGALPPDSLQR